MRNNNIIFGNENAEHDSLLYDCKILHSTFDKFQHRIITGRWGTGKSAQLFIINEDLTKIISETDKKYSNIWYITEDDLDFSSLFSESIKYADLRKFRKILEKIWFAEILRRAVVILGHLDEYYGSKSGMHWETIRKIFKKTKLGITLWKQLPKVLSIISSKEKGDALSDIQEELSDIFSDTLFEQIQLCLADIDDNKIYPIIAVEPLETPNSDLDKQVSLAQQVITSLLNVFEKKFQPSSDQFLDVYLAIPWHRYKIGDINLPQKISEYRYYLQWNKEELKNFINERICWEFDRVGRVKYDKKNAWYELFEDTIKRDSFEIPVIEDTFEYALRFTHHRPRDIQKLTRLALKKSSEIVGRTKDSILRGTGGIKINGSHLRKAVHEFRKETCEYLIEEVLRGNPNFDEYLNVVKGLPARFKLKEFHKRTNNDNKFSKLCLSNLWDAGIIGVELYCNKDQQKFHALLPERVRKTDRNIKGESITRGYYFEYNHDEDIHQILSKHSENNGCELHLVFHPKTFDTLISNQTKRWPIGS